MMFVKIEVYLMNFYHIYQNYNYPLVKTAFNRIKLAAKAQKSSAALASLVIMGKIKKALHSLQVVEKRKNLASLTSAFARIRDRPQFPALVEQMRVAKTTNIKRMKELLVDKKEEIEFLSAQIEDLNGRTKSKYDVGLSNKTKDSEVKTFEKKKLQNKVGLGHVALERRGSPPQTQSQSQGHGRKDTDLHRGHKLYARYARRLLRGQRPVCADLERFFEQQEFP